MTHSSASTASPTALAPNSAVRQPNRLANANIKTGAAAQPMLPPNVCTPNARPSRLCDTVAFKMVKSAGWKTLLPSPTSTMAGRNIQNSPSNPSRNIITQ